MATVSDLRVQGLDAFCKVICCLLFHIGQAKMQHSSALCRNRQRVEKRVNNGRVGSVIHLLLVHYLSPCIPFIMLTLLRIQNIATIEELEIEFQQGLNIITGETGAGKSIIITALQLIYGSKATSAIVRQGKANAQVEACFELEPKELISLDDVDLERSMIIRRVVQQSGRTRSYINGALVPYPKLQKLASKLLDISSQHQYHQLASSSSHLHYLDAFAGLEKTVMQAHYRDCLQTKQRLDECEHKLAQSKKEEELLSFQVQEIEEANLKQGEDTALEQNLKQLQHTEELSRTTQQAQDTLYSVEGSITEQIASITTLVHHAATLDPALQEHAQVLETSLHNIEEVAASLGQYGRNISYDEQTHRTMEDRLFHITKLCDKYGGSIQSTLSFLSEAKQRLCRIHTYEHEQETHTKLWKQQKKQALDHAECLSKQRHRAAEKLSAQITKELSSLGMKKATLTAKVTPIQSGTGIQLADVLLHPSGKDQVQLMIAPNPGSSLKPLGTIASGGELSRTLLAIKSVLSSSDILGTYVFDEVDTGVGGSIAQIVGQKLAKVAKHHQVICVTHLAQVAIYADEHFKVSKQDIHQLAFTQIQQLNPHQRKEEIARMLGGLSLNDTTRAAAEDLLKQAHLS